MYMIGAVAAKGFIRVEAVRRIAIRYFDVDMHPILTALSCLMVVLLCAFWIPVAIYAFVIV